MSQLLALGIIEVEVTITGSEVNGFTVLTDSSMMMIDLVANTYKDLS